VLNIKLWKRRKIFLTLIKAMFKFLPTIFLLIAMSSCVSRLERHGYMFDFSDHEMLQEGITSKEKLLRVMGSPTIISNLESDEAWIYFAEKTDSFLFFKPDIVERSVLVIRFDGLDTIREIKKLSLANESQKIDFVSNYTAVDSHKKDGFFKSIFSNVGQVRPQ